MTSAASTKFYLNTNWLSKVLPELTRSSTIGLHSRFENLCEAGGAEAVINELADVESDHLRASYLELLLAKPLEAKELQRTVIAINQYFNSNHPRYKLLKNNSQLFFSTPENKSE